MLQCLKDRFFVTPCTFWKKALGTLLSRSTKKGLIGIPEVAGEEGADDASTEEDRLPEISNDSL